MTTRPTETTTPVVSRRRALKITAAAGALPALAAAGCTTSPTGQVVLNPAVVDTIQGAVALGCSIFPLVASIAGIVGASFPAVGGAVSITAAVANQIADLICKAYMSQQTAAGTLRGTAMVGAVEIHGWHVVNGVLTKF